MAALVTITTFSGLAPPWSLSQLDTNLQNLQTAIQNQNSFSNYLTDTGAANAYVVTPAAGITGTLTAGLMLQFKAANANTGASTLNYNALGATNILNLNGSALSAGQIPLNAVVQVIYDGTQFVLLNTVPVYVTTTWTPSVGGTATYLVQSGEYTKVGRLVFIRGSLQINAIGTGSTTTISGLPFPNSGANSASITVSDLQSSATAIVYIAGNITNGASAIVLKTLAAAGVSFSTANAIFQNNTLIQFSGCYNAT